MNTTKHANSGPGYVGIVITHLRLLLLLLRLFIRMSIPRAEAAFPRGRICRLQSPQQFFQFFLVLKLRLY